MAESAEKVICDICKRGNTTTTASFFCIDCEEKLCDQCNTHHNRNKASSDHTVHKITSIGDIELFKSLKQLTQCSVHVQKKIEYLCNDHDNLCCSECAIVGHRKCDNIVAIADEISKKATKRKSSTLDVLKQLEKYADLLLAHEETEQISTHAAYLSHQTALETLKKNLENGYSMLYDEVTEDASAKRDKVTHQISKQQGDIGKYRDELNEMTEKVATVKRIGNNMHLYLSDRDLKHRLDEYKNKMKELQRNVTDQNISLTETSSEETMTEALGTFIAVEIARKTVKLPDVNVDLTYEEAKAIKVQSQECTKRKKKTPRVNLF